MFFCPHLFVFWGTSQADCGVGDMNKKVHHPGIPSLSVYTSTRWILGDSIKVYHRDFCRENCLIWLRECWSSQSGGARIQLHGSGAPDFSNSSKTRAKPTTYETVSWLGWVRPSVVCPLEASVGSTPLAKERRGVERPEGNLRGRFWPNPGFNNIWRSSPYRIFRFVGKATQVYVAGFC